jgi:hypothetical protein
MLSRYHIEITKNSLENFFTPASFREITRANVRQDSFASLFGIDARRHVCDCTVAESLAYVEEEHQRIAELAYVSTGAAQQRAALGRLLHTVQDFYAHTNYVSLWLAERRPGITDEQVKIDAFDPDIFDHPALQIAQWSTWREPLYYVPGLGDWMRRVCLPASSHEAINLDSPRRGSLFGLAMSVAHQRTLVEYARAVVAIRAIGGREAVARFHGGVGYAHHPSPAQA